MKLTKKYPILELLKQRRIWAGIIGVVGFVITTFNMPYELGDTATLIDLLTAWGDSLAMFVGASLALSSYFKPKVK